jgi:hypothetical protein
MEGLDGKLGHLVLRLTLEINTTTAGSLAAQTSACG